MKEESNISGLARIYFDDSFIGNNVFISQGKDVELNRIKEKQVEEPRVEYGKDVLSVAAVVESSEYQYGADAFEAEYPKMKQDKAVDVKTPTVRKIGKVK